MLFSKNGTIFNRSLFVVGSIKKRRKMIRHMCIVCITAWQGTGYAMNAKEYQLCLQNHAQVFEYVKSTDLKKLRECLDAKSYAQIKIILAHKSEKGEKVLDVAAKTYQAIHVQTLVDQKAKEIPECYKKRVLAGFVGITGGLIAIGSLFGYLNYE